MGTTCSCPGYVNNFFDACHAPENSTPQQVPSGTFVFAITVKDWMQGGQQRWQHWDAAAITFKGPGSFETTVFER